MADDLNELMKTQRELDLKIAQAMVPILNEMKAEMEGEDVVGMLGTAAKSVKALPDGPAKSVFNNLITVVTNAKIVVDEELKRMGNIIASNS